MPDTIRDVDAFADRCVVSADPDKSPREIVGVSQRPYRLAVTVHDDWLPVQESPCEMVAVDDRAGQSLAIGVAGTNDRHRQPTGAMGFQEPGFALRLAATVGPEGIAQRRVFDDERSGNGLHVGGCRRNEHVLAATTGERLDVTLDRFRTEGQELTDHIEST